MSIHLYTKIWANMRTCYCNGVTSDPPSPAAVAGPGMGTGPGASTGSGAVRPLEMQCKSRLDHQNRDFGFMSGPGATRLKSVYPSCRFGMSIHLYTKIWANMRTCYCNGVTSDPPSPAAVAGPGLGAGPGVRSGAGPGAVRPLEMQRKSRLDHQKRDFGYISGPSPTAAAASRAPVQRRRLHLRSKRKRPRRTSRRGRTNRSVLQSAAIEDYSSL